MMMRSGRVKWFDVSKGYGFIRVDGDDTDLFVHITCTDPDLEYLVVGQRVQFTEGVSKQTGKPEAQNVVLAKD